MSSLATVTVKTKGREVDPAATSGWARTHPKLEQPPATSMDWNPLLGFAAELRLAGRLPQRVR
jgi:hypothetical protein